MKSFPFFTQGLQAHQGPQAEEASLERLVQLALQDPMASMESVVQRANLVNPGRLGPEDLRGKLGYRGSAGNLVHLAVLGKWVRREGQVLLVLPDLWDRLGVPERLGRRVYLANQVRE